MRISILNIQFFFEKNIHKDFQEVCRGVDLLLHLYSTAEEAQEDKSVSHSGSKSVFRIY